MPDFPYGAVDYAPQGTISSWGAGFDGLGAAIKLSTGMVLTTAYTTAFKIYYMPVSITRPVTTTKFMWHNGATVAGNVDMGVYDVNGNRLINLGSTAMAGASAIQVATVASTTFLPGNYFLAFQSDSTTATFSTLAMAILVQRACGIQQEVPGAIGLPATWTPAAPATNAFYPCVGIGILPAGAY